MRGAGGKREDEANSGEQSSSQYDDAEKHDDRRDDKQGEVSRVIDMPATMAEAFDLALLCEFDHFL